MADKDIALMAHLMRRAGFGAQYDELEARAAKGYEATVEELLHPEDQPNGLDMDVAERYFIEWNHFTRGVPEYWAFRMINSKNQLEEKMVLFWHGVLCTADSKVQSYVTLYGELEMFRRCGMGSFRDLLVEISRDPAMVFFLDNCMSHKGAINENYGRELLELFSMGVGMDGQLNYTEEDVKECARAFTGWTVANGIPALALWPLCCQDSSITPPTMITAKRPSWATPAISMARTSSTSSVSSRPPPDSSPATCTITSSPTTRRCRPGRTPHPRTRRPSRCWKTSTSGPDYDIRSMLRVLFNSDFFKNARFARIKSPVEAVVGTMRLIGDWTAPKPGFEPIFDEMKHMGQELLNPPSVEGWHTGKEWIDSGTLVQRINFTADHVGDLSYPGIQDIITKLAAEGPTLSPERLVDGCLRLLGHYELADETRRMLVEHAQKSGEVRTTSCGVP